MKTFVRSALLVCAAGLFALSSGCIGQVETSELDGAHVDASESPEGQTSEAKSALTCHGSCDVTVCGGGWCTVYRCDVNGCHAIDIYAETEVESLEP